MAEVAAVHWNGYRAISAFSGCGGSCLGYRMAGFNVIWANEFIQAARETYLANHPSCTMDGRDIRKIQPEEILRSTGLKAGELDLMDGSPPCASFSTAGKRERDWGKVKEYSDTRQRVDDLFFEYARLLQGLQPKVFVAENVSGLIKGTAKGFFLQILQAFKECGYKVNARLLDAQWLGVPQMRQRLIFIGVRNDLAAEPVFPKPLPYRYSVRDALPLIVRHGTAPTNEDFIAAKRDIEATFRDSDTQPSPTLPTSVNNGVVHVLIEKVPIRVIHDTSGDYARAEDVTDQPCPAITVGVNSVNSHHYQVEELDISRFAIGDEWDKLGPGETSDRYFNLVKPHPDRPSPTVTAAGGNLGAAAITHPTEKRKFTIPELKRICSFPDDFILTGSYTQQWERLGRAVPPVMMSYIARTIRDEILEELP